MTVNHLPDPDETTTKKYYSIAGQMVAMHDGSSLKYFAQDHLSSTSLVMDNTGGLLSHNRYMPFGEVRDITGSNDPITQTDFGFTGQRNISGMGLMDYRARFYSPVLGRFTQPDTIVPSLSNPQSLNRFSYVINNPLFYTDSSGHFPWAIIPVIILLLTLSGDTPQDDVPEGSAFASDMALRVTCEPYDIAMTVGTCVSGECGVVDYLSLLPLIPGGLGKADEILKASKGVTKGATNSDEVVDLYRAVEKAELDDVLKSGEFRPRLDDDMITSLEDKEFWTTLEDANAYANTYPGRHSTDIIEIEVPTSTLDQGYFWPELDNIGPAYGFMDEALELLNKTYKYKGSYQIPR